MIILACFLLIFGSFYIAFNNLENNKDENLAVVENEEKILEKELDGYIEYKKKVK